MSLALLLARQLRHRPWPTLLLALTGPAWVTARSGS